MAAKGGNGDPLGCSLYPQLAEVRAFEFRGRISYVHLHAELAALNAVNLEAMLVIPYGCFRHCKLAMVSGMSLEVIIFVIPWSVLYALK